jgi:hypothetical protein
MRFEASAFVKPAGNLGVPPLLRQSLAHVTGSSPETRSSGSFSTLELGKGVGFVLISVF